MSAATAHGSAGGRDGRGNGDGGNKRNRAPPADKVDITTKNGIALLTALIVAMLNVVNLGTIPTSRAGLDSWLDGLVNAPWGVKQNRFSKGAIAFVDVVIMVRNLAPEGKDLLLDIITEWQNPEDEEGDNDDE